MFSFFKRLSAVLILLIVVSVILNLKIGGEGARVHAMRIWRAPVVQKIYTEVRGRFLAVVRKDISVEDAFKPSASKTGSESRLQNSSTPAQTIDLDKLDEKDRKALKEILERAAK